MIDFLKYFELVIQLLELDVDVDSYIKIASYMQDGPDKDYVFLHRHAFLFQSFLDLIGGKMSVEEFTKVGDVYSQRPLYMQENDSVLFFDKLKDDEKVIALVKDSVVILDSSVGNIYKNSELDAIFSDNNVELLTC